MANGVVVNYFEPSFFVNDGKLRLPCQRNVDGVRFGMAHGSGMDRCSLFKSSKSSSFATSVL